MANFYQKYGMTGSFALWPVVLVALIYASYKVSDSLLACDKKASEEREKWCRVGKWAIAIFAALILTSMLTFVPSAVRKYRKK